MTERSAHSHAKNNIFRGLYVDIFCLNIFLHLLRNSLISFFCISLTWLLTCKLASSSPVMLSVLHLSTDYHFENLDGFLWYNINRQLYIVSYPSVEFVQDPTSDYEDFP